MENFLTLKLCRGSGLQENDYYYKGGYILKTYGSKDGGYIDAIQIETSKDVREGGDEKRKHFAHHLASTVKKFMEAHNYLD